MKRILFVDDDTNVLDGIRRILHAERKRWDMQFAVGGEAALQAPRESFFPDMPKARWPHARFLWHTAS
jgi:CheY-like chemotaxis protein